MENKLFSMEGKTVVFTGGCGNLGKVLVKCLLDFGANVAVPGKTDRFDDSFTPFRESGKLLFVHTDLSCSDDTKNAFATVHKTFEKIDVLVNCAAYGGGAGGKTAEYRLDKIDDETWRTGIEGTLDIAFRCTREVIPYFEKNGSGNIINFSSMYGISAPDFKIYQDAAPTPPFYGAGKAGLLQYTRYCAAALAERGIRVNAITPGPFPKITENTDMQFIGRLSDKTMLKRTGNPEELCGALILLCSDASSYMTGANIVVDGGMTQFV